MKKCRWIKVDGQPCTMLALEGSDSCANHDPDAKYARQHPAYRARLLARIAEGSDRKFIPRKAKCPAITRKGLPCPNVGLSEDGYLCHVHKVGTRQIAQRAS